MVEPRVYRTRLPLRIAVLLAAALWAGVLALLLLAPQGAEPRAMLGAAAFVVFFGAFSWVYGRTWIRLTPGGLVSRTPFHLRPIPYADIERIVVQDGLAGRVYAVFTRRGLVRFTSLLARHRELFEALRNEAGLQPL